MNPVRGASDEAIQLGREVGKQKIRRSEGETKKKIGIRN